MNASNLTPGRISQLQPGEDIADPLSPGLRVRANADGTKSFLYQYRNLAGQRRQVVIGQFGAALTLAEARKQWRKLKAARDAGTDLQAEKQSSRAAAKAEVAAAKADRFTVAVAVEDYCREVLDHRSHGAEPARLLNKHVVPVLGKIPVAKLKRTQVRDCILAILPGSRRGAGQALTVLASVFKFAMTHKRLDPDTPLPTEGVREQLNMVLAPGDRKALRGAERDRHLSDAELRKVLLWWRDPQCALSASVRDALHLALLTGARTGEVVGAQWSNIDLERGEWVLPTTKTGRGTIVLLSTQAVALLQAREGLDDVRVFPGTAKRQGKTARPARAPLEQKALARGLWLARNLPASSKLAGDPLDLPWTPHDVRRSVATGLARLGTVRETVKRVLGHSDGSVTARYDRFSRDDEARLALQRWADHLDGLVAPNVVQLGERSRA